MVSITRMLTLMPIEIRFSDILTEACNRIAFTARSSYVPASCMIAPRCIRRPGFSRSCRVVSFARHVPPSTADFAPVHMVGTRDEGVRTFELLSDERQWDRPRYISLSFRRNCCAFCCDCSFKWTWMSVDIDFQVEAAAYAQVSRYLASVRGNYELAVIRWRLNWPLY